MAHYEPVIATFLCFQPLFSCHLRTRLTKLRDFFLISFLFSRLASEGCSFSDRLDSSFTYGGGPGTYFVFFFSGAILLFFQTHDTFSFRGHQRTLRPLSTYSIVLHTICIPPAYTCFVLGLPARSVGCTLIAPVCGYEDRRSFLLFIMFSSDVKCDLIVEFIKSRRISYLILKY